jgi:2'-carboxy-2,3-dihydroxybiphenyl 1,2-dioxygenase small subunit/ferredoxin
MNYRLDAMLRRCAEEEAYRQQVAAAPDEAAHAAGIPLAHVLAALQGDLVQLYEAGAHSLILMELAGALRIDPMERFGPIPQTSAPKSIR